MPDSARILAACGDQAVIERTSEEGEVSVQSASLIRDGQPINGMEEVLQLVRRKDDRTRFDVHVLHKGPARAASPAYRENHEAIFGRTEAEKQLLN
jgi:hypothetical protein